MVLSNAERQRRHRERTKEKLRQAGQPTGVAPTQDNELRDLLEGQYRAAGLELLEAHADEWDGSSALLEEFRARPLTALDMVKIMQAAGQKAAVELFERWANARVAEARQRPERPATAPKPAKVRRVRRVT